MNVLFVCTGNTCRSPMAEGYLNSKNIKGLRALSCGFSAPGMPVSANAAAVMKEKGVDISEHRSRYASAQLLSADKVFCMSSSHRAALTGAGVKTDKVFILGGGISDPYGQSIEVYRICRDKIISAIDALLYGGEFLPAEILPADENDAASIADLEKRCFSSPWSEAAVLEGLEHNTVFFKAVSGGNFAGYISVTAVADEGYINNIAVDEEYRGRGLGSLLLDRAVTFAREKNLAFLSLEVRKSNAAAISLYEKLGFCAEGEREGFYDDPKEDGIIMTRRFNV